MEEGDEDPNGGLGLVANLDLSTQTHPDQVQGSGTSNYFGSIHNIRCDNMLEGDFCYTGLLEGRFDTIYTPVPEQKRVALSAEGSTSIVSQQTDEENQGPGYLNFGADNDPWEQNLFTNLELDEEIQTEQERSDTKNDSKHTEETQHTNRRRTEEERELCEEDVENFMENEKDTEDETTSAQIEISLKPELGMVFKTREEAQNCFNMYAYAVGFSVVIVSTYRTTSRKRNNEITRVTIKCNKFGKNSEEERELPVAQRQSSVIDRSDCKVEMIVHEKEGLWHIKTLTLDHNHKLDPQSRFFRSHTFMTVEEKAMIRSLKHSNIPTRQIVSVLSYLRGGADQLPYNKKKVRNYGTTVNREMKNSDMMEVLAYFSKKRAADPEFYYSFQIDANNKVHSILWADAKARTYYETCGDCISFDTTFLTNKYNLPFAPIVGVSPHGNTYLFGCALVGNERTKSFEWIFTEFISAMGGKHPQTIITDQDVAMKAAIKKVMKNTIHRSCLFHVKSKAEAGLGNTFRANQGLYEEFQDIIDNSLTEQEFELLWQQMIKDYKVGHIKYFQDLWETRKKFVPVYFKNNFFPFLQTTARSEGTNSLFKRGVGATYSVTSFLREYQRIMDSMHSREDESEHKAIHKTVPPKTFITKYNIEAQAHSYYNIYIFRKFQKILNDVTRLHIKEERQNELYLVFQSKSYRMKEHRHREYVVHVNLEKAEFYCVCCKFDKDGMLCSHILKVMLHMDVAEIPEKYFIDRWRKNDKRSLPNKLPGSTTDSNTLRYNVLTRRLVGTASKASENDSKYKYLLTELDRIDRAMADMDTTEEERKKQDDNTIRTLSNFATATPNGDTNSTIELVDPDVVNTKGRPRLLTIKEQIAKGTFYKCGHCGDMGHTVKKCTNLDKQYNLKKKGKQKPKQTTGAQDISIAPAVPKKRRAPAKKGDLAPKSNLSDENIEPMKEKEGGTQQSSSAAVEQMKIGRAAKKSKNNTEPAAPPLPPS